MPKLEHCDKLFLRYFDPWYSNADRGRRGFKATKPDMFTVERFIGAVASEISPLPPEGQEDVLKRVAAMIEAARGDWPGYLPVSGDMDISWVAGFDDHFDRARVAEVVARSDPKEFGCDYIVLCCEFGAVLSHVLRARQPRLIWRLDWPCWESMLVDPKTGALIPTFHWAVKKMSGYGVEDGFAEKVEHCLRILDREQV